MEKSRNHIIHYNKTPVNMLGTLTKQSKARSGQCILSLVPVYNCTKHEHVNYSPFELTFGSKHRLPVHLASVLQCI